MTFQFFYTLLLLALMTIILAKEWFDVEITVFAVLLLLIVGDVITPQEAFSGFSNLGVLTIGILFIIAGAIRSTGLLEILNRFIYGKSRDRTGKQLLRMMLPVASISAFTNNAPIVAIMIHSVRDWTRKNNLSLSKFLIPLSYAAIFGGMCTLIGTSTNLIVHGLLLQNGYEGMGFFEISRIGIPAALLGIVYMTFIGHRLLPERKEPMVELGDCTREYVLELKVKEDYRHIGKTIEKAGLRHLQGLFLFQIERSGEIIAPARPHEQIQLDDRLFFTGIPETIFEIQKTPGLQLIKDSKFNFKQYDADRVNTYEAVISHSSPLIGKNVRESNFRFRYNAVIIAIHRNGHRINKKIGDIVLHPGDTLLLLSEENLIDKWYHSPDFLLLSNSTRVYSKPKKNAWFAGSALILMIILTLLKILPLITAAGFAAIFLIATRSISAADVKSAIDWKVLLVIAASFGIAVAIQNSGLAAFLAEQIVRLKVLFGTIGVLAGVYFLTSIYNLIITSNATAALFFPIALSAALAVDSDIRPFALAVAISAAASFASPISYQTNLMVYGPGGYQFRDYLRVGLPLQFLIGVLSISLIYIYYF